MTQPHIDLHMHSSFSDGTDTPEELLRKFRDTDIDIFSLTDHDEIEAGNVILSARRSGDPQFITGVEFSCRDEYGKYHILGYRYDPNAESMIRLVNRAYGLRIIKAFRRLEWLEKAFGFSFPPEDIADLLSHRNPGKPHIADMMIAHGYAPDKSNAITQYISCCPVQIEYVTPNEAISAILQGGGIPVLAHGLFGNGDQKDHPLARSEMEARIARLKEAGLQGLECFYSGFTAEQTELMLELKNQYCLYATAGSDYHGTNKAVKLCDIGTAGTANRVRVYEELKPFLKACGIDSADLTGDRPDMTEQKRMSAGNMNDTTEETLAFLTELLKTAEITGEEADLALNGGRVGLAKFLSRYCHRGQKDKAGEPYFKHPETVAARVTSEDEKIVALLHDTLEDTDLAPETIRRLFGQDILDGVRAMTRCKNETYEEFIVRCGKNLLGRAVKLADLSHNMDLSRLSKVTESNLRHYRRYHAATAYLQGPMDEASTAAYLNSAKS